MGAVLSQLPPRSSFLGASAAAEVVPVLQLLGPWQKVHASLSAMPDPWGRDFKRQRLQAVCRLRERFGDEELLGFRSTQLARIERMRVPGAEEQLRGRLLRIAGYPDKACAPDNIAGFTLFGNIGPVEGWELSGETPCADVAAARVAILAKAASRRARHEWKLPYRHKAEIWEKLHAEVRRGWLDVPVRAKDAQSQLGPFASWLVFGVEETKTVNGTSVQALRLCVDPDEPNAVTAVLSKTPMADVDGVADLFRAVHSAVCGPLQGAKEDWEAGFRALDLAEIDRNLFCVHAEDLRGLVWIFRPRRLLFGPRAGPPQFCRRSGALDFLAGALLCIASTSHVDDHIIADKAGPCASSAHVAFVKLAELLGDPLKVEKAVPGRDEVAQATSSLVAVGVHWELQQDSAALARDGVLARLTVPEAKRDKYRGLIKADLRSDRLSPPSAAKRVGQMESLASSTWGQQTRSLHWPLYERKRQTAAVDDRMTPALRWSLRELDLHLDLASARSLFIRAAGRPRRIVFTDARGRHEQVYGTELLGGAVLPPHGVHLQGFPALVCGSVQEYEAWLPQPCSQDDAQQRINECESLAAVVTLCAFASDLAGSDVMWAIDSSAAEGTSRSGYSPNRFLCALAGEFWRLTQEYDIRVWLYRVPSKSNLADPISRGELASFRDFRQVEAPKLDPSSWWHLQGTGPRRAGGPRKSS